MIVGYRSHGVRPTFSWSFYLIYMKGYHNGNTDQSFEHTAY